MNKGNKDNKDKKAFSEKGNWYKGNLHCHTNKSDGILSPAEAAELYRRNGYQFLCISDHERYADYRDELNREDFIVLPGVESSVNLILPGEQTRETDNRNPLWERSEWLKEREGMKAVLKTHHIHGILGTGKMQEEAQSMFEGKEEDQKVYVYAGEWDGLGAAQRQIEDFKKKGCLVMYNHPLWSKVRPEEYYGLKDIWAMEIYNHSTVLDSGLGIDTRDWDALLEKGVEIYGVASDDNHNTPPIPDSCGGWVMVKAQSLTQEELVQNLQSGNFYSSSGPDIYDWGIKDGAAYIDCSPCERINFICGGPLCSGITVLKGQFGCVTEKERLEKREYMEHAEYKLNGMETYIRAECIDQYGKTAWTNAIMLDGEEKND